jgi:hypothetical protein
MFKTIREFFFGKKSTPVAVPEAPYKIEAPAVQEAPVVHPPLVDILQSADVQVNAAKPAAVMTPVRKKPAAKPAVKPVAKPAVKPVARPVRKKPAAK